MPLYILNVKRFFIFYESSENAPGKIFEVVPDLEKTSINPTHHPVGIGTSL